MKKDTSIAASIGIGYRYTRVTSKMIGRRMRDTMDSDSMYGMILKIIGHRVFNSMPYIVEG